MPKRSNHENKLTLGSPSPKSERGSGGEVNHEPTRYFQMERAQQITDSHCGPAVIQMLISNIGVKATQEQIARAGGAEDFIEMHGMRVDQLAEAVKALAPQARLWFKDHSTLDELKTLVMEYKFPVGVEWQGLFEEEGEDDPEPDYGHYSVITYVDPQQDKVIIVDPYKNYYVEDRVFPLDEFDKRWI